MNKQPATWLSIVVMAAGLTAAAGCKREQPAPPAAVENVKEVKENPQAYYGREVTIIGEVDQVYGTRAFELESTDLFDEQVLVASRSAMWLGDSTLADDQKVQVTGTVRAMVVAEIERELGWDLEPEIEAEFRTRPIIVARSVARVDRPELAWSEGTTATGSGTGSAAARGQPMTDVGTIAAARGGNMAGRPVELQQVSVQDVVSERVFWIGSAADQRVLVVLDRQPTPKQASEGLEVKKGQTISLTGTLRQVPHDDMSWRQQLKLENKSEEILQKPAMYVDASKVEVTPKTPTAGRRPPR